MCFFRSSQVPPVALMIFLRRARCLQIFYMLIDQFVFEYIQPAVLVVRVQQYGNLFRTHNLQ